MNRKREKDEHLERLWNMKEEGKNSMDVLKDAMDKDFNADIVNELSSDGLVELKEGGTKIILTKKGEDVARKLIRAHRLAERMLHDVVGGDFETGACEFEHTITPELVDGLCTLLGHPRECPHGMPIPQGECCKSSAKIVQSSVVPLTELKIGQSARVAHVYCKSDQQLHKIDGLHIRPGSIVKLHQTYPSYVIECEGASIALDSDVASNICVWKDSSHSQFSQGEAVGQGQGGHGRGFRFRRRRSQS